MTKGFSRRLFLSSLAASFAAGPVLAEAPLVSIRPTARAGDLHKRAVRGTDAILAAAGLSGAVAFSVADAATGLRLEEHEGTQATPPASVAKAITALYALDVLGPNHRFRTQLVATGGVSNGIVAGDLVLVGGGDPTLDTDDLAHMAANLKAAGIREVRGDFLVYQGALPYVRTIDTGQPDHVGYSPAVCGLALNYNRVHFEWKRAANGYGVTMDARTRKYRPDVSMARMTIAERNLPVYTYKSTNAVDSWTVSKRALGKGGARWLPVRKPGLYAGDVFQTLARSQGIVLKRPRVVNQRPKGQAIVIHSSDDLRSILQAMLKYSTNVTAEMVGMSASAVRTGRATSLSSSAAQMNSWAKSALGMNSPKMVDHSGLGPGSRMTARDMVSALVSAQQSDVLRPILKDIVLRDEKGRPNKAHPVKVRAKTGTLNFVSGLAGYITARDDTELAFAIFAADQKKRNAISRANREAPQGARPWNTRAKRLQQRLIERWGILYGS